MTEKAKCAMCGKGVVGKDVKIAEITGCCSTIRVELCGDCWQQYNERGQANVKCGCEVQEE